MVRVTIWLGLATAVFALLCGAALAFELAAPDGTALLAWLAGHTGLDGGILYYLGAFLHGGLALAMLALSGAAAAAVSIRHRGPSGGPLALLGILLALGLAAMAALPLLPPAALPAPLPALVTADPRITALWTASAAVTMALLGAGALAGARQGYRWTGRVVQIATLIALAATVAAGIETGDPGPVVAIIGLPLLVLLASLSAQLADEDVPAAPYLWTGALVTLAGLVLATLTFDTDGPAAAPQLMLAGMLHATAYAFGPFCLLAALNRAWEPRIDPALTWLHAIALAGLTLLTALPLAGAGGHAERARLPAQPDAPDHLLPAMALWGGAQVAWILLGIVLMAARAGRGRAPQ